MAIKEEKRKRKQEIQDQQSQLTRVVRHHHKDPFGLNAWSDLLLGKHFKLSGIHRFHGNRLHGHGIHGNHGIHGSHGDYFSSDSFFLTTKKNVNVHYYQSYCNIFRQMRCEYRFYHLWLIKGELLGNRPQHTYEVHQDVNEDTSFSWHGLTAGFGSFYGARPSSTSIKIENKIAPEENRQKISKYPTVDVNSQNKITKIRNKLIHEYDDDSPIENKIAPKSGKVAFVW